MDRELEDEQRDSLPDLRPTRRRRRTSSSQNNSTRPLPPSRRESLQSIESNDPDCHSKIKGHCSCGGSHSANPQVDEPVGWVPQTYSYDETTYGMLMRTERKRKTVMVPIFSRDVPNEPFIPGTPRSGRSTDTHKEYFTDPDRYRRWANASRESMQRAQSDFYMLKGQACSLSSQAGRQTSHRQDGETQSMHTPDSQSQTGDIEDDVSTQYHQKHRKQNLQQRRPGRKRGSSPHTIA